MKKIALLSFVYNLNYGGSLQFYALEKALEQKYPNIEFEYINYSKNQIVAMVKWFFRKIIFKICQKNDEPSWSVKEYLRIATKTFKAEKSVEMQENLKLFQEFWELSKYSEPMNRKNLAKTEYDLYIVGSDQTWNCGRVDLDKTYLLDFVQDDRKKASYAPSLAMKEIPEKYRKNYKKYLSCFQYLSCREMNGAEIISDLIMRDVECVLDPVFLLTAKEWDSISRLPKGCKEQDSYVLVYLLEESERLARVAQKYAKKNNAKIKYIYGDIEKNQGIGPNEWLGLFRHAKYIITNSFHGTAFAIIFNTPFQVEITNEIFFQQSSDRITDLLSLTKLNDRLCIDESVLDEMEIDFLEVNNILLKERESSYRYISDMVKE